ncbi:uncharacterized protein [Physcomitrium patens]|uniref:2-phosphoglycerate kinase n=1 Tax=Physcomitrium patens TaxID=3218 RepID=A0A2K1L1C6_PHYPA|nr:uncharacterized protein LOC112294559 isoform X1 [Physcomitrium patens]PNR59828.1 hypothetical protein PHYPA_002620 [Physcomitrium patens]|eukprot:XP_024400920.1 uncharacterized protein LOC112294559 isoform X1 [Physcomitrella patens]
MASGSNGTVQVEEATAAGGSGHGAPQTTPGSGPQTARGTASKYDFVKVKVWLGANSDHYYILSRFLISRMLLVTKIPNHVAIKISLELKKLLIDNSLLDVSQSDLEANLFKLMERRGYGAEYIERYKMMTRFHHQRMPLIILVCGTACVGKSTLATQLAQRLNLPNVLQTDMVYELLRTTTDHVNSAPLASTPVWARDFASSEELITEFCRECRVVRKGLDGDLKKAMKDGKPVIIEGLHLDPAIYLMNEESGGFGSGAVQMKASPSRPDSAAVAEGTNNGASGESVVSKDEKLPVKWTPPKCIIVPVVLKMADVDHQTLLQEWTASRTAETGKSVSQEDKDALIRRLQIIQDYLTSFESQGMTVVNLSATTFPQTLDWMHSYLLKCIDQGSTSPGPAAGS